MPKLPEDVRRVGVVTKKQSTAILLVVNIYSEDGPDGKPIHDQLKVSNYATLQIKDELARVDGIGDVFMFGARDYAVRVWLDPAKMDDMKLAANDVVNAIRRQNVQVAAGQIGQPPTPKGTAFQLVVTSPGRLPDANAFKNIIVKRGDKEQLVRLKDVVRDPWTDDGAKHEGVELGARSYDTTSTLDGRPSVGLATFQLPGANAFETAQKTREVMKRLEERFPAGMKYSIVFDPTQFVEASVEAVVNTLFEAIVLVFVVVLVFLQNWRSALIPMLAVPVALIGTLAVLYAVGYSINNLTLFGMVLAIGIVVDDAIVVVEAVEFHIARGLSPREATEKAMSEVSGAIVGVSLVLCACSCRPCSCRG